MRPMVFSSGSGVPPAPAAAVAGGTGAGPRHPRRAARERPRHQEPGRPYPAEVRQSFRSRGGGIVCPGFGSGGQPAAPQGRGLPRLRPGPWQGPGPEGCPPEVPGTPSAASPAAASGAAVLSPAQGLSWMRAPARPRRMPVQALYRKSRQERPCPRRLRAYLRPPLFAGPRKRRARPAGKGVTVTA